MVSAAGLTIMTCTPDVLTACNCDHGQRCQKDKKSRSQKAVVLDRSFGMGLVSVNLLCDGLIRPARFCLFISGRLFFFLGWFRLDISAKWNPLLGHPFPGQLATSAVFYVPAIVQRSLAPRTGADIGVAFLIILRRGSDPNHFLNLISFDNQEVCSYHRYYRQLGPVS
jgi:hypothetical protein